MSKSKRDKTAIPTKEELAKLPRWARVAFAARCARRVQPLFRHSWPEAPQEHLQSIDAAITLAEAGSGTASVIADAAAAAPSTAYAAAYAANAARATAHAAAYAADAARATAHAANAARAIAYAAADAAYAAAHAAANAAYAAYAAAHAAARAAAAADAAMRRDFELLKFAAKREAWNDETPVPPEFFGPLWPDGPPIGWPMEDETSVVDGSPTAMEGGAPLSLYFDLNEYSADDIATFVSQLSAVYREISGDELIIDDARVLELDLVPEEV